MLCDCAAGPVPAEARAPTPVPSLTTPPTHPVKMAEREEQEKLAAEERQIEMFKVKKLITSLEKARG